MAQKELTIECRECGKETLRTTDGSECECGHCNTCRVCQEDTRDDRNEGYHKSDLCRDCESNMLDNYEDMQKCINHAWQLYGYEFENDEEINGGDFVEDMANWRAEHKPLFHILSLKRECKFCGDPVSADDSESCAACA